MKSSEVHCLSKLLEETYRMTVLVFEGGVTKRVYGSQGGGPLTVVWQTIDRLWQSLSTGNWGLIQDVRIIDDQGRHWLLHAVDGAPRAILAVGPLGTEGRPTYDQIVRLLTPAKAWHGVAAPPRTTPFRVNALNRTHGPAMVEAIRAGDLDAYDGAAQGLLAWWQSVFVEGSFDRIMGVHLAFIAYAEAAAVKAGVDPEVAESTSEVCIRTIEITPDPRDAVKALILRLRRFAELAAQIHLHGKSAPVRTMLRFLSQNLHRAVTLKETSSVAGLSPNYAGSLLKLETGEGFTDTLRRLRVERAQNLLRSTRVPIQEIANLVGFRQPDYFAKVFQAQVGCAPREYRRSAWETGDFSGVPSPTEVTVSTELGPY